MPALGTKPCDNPPPRYIEPDIPGHYPGLHGRPSATIRGKRTGSRVSADRIPRWRLIGGCMEGVRAGRGLGSAEDRQSPPQRHGPRVPRAGADQKHSGPQPCTSIRLLASGRGRPRDFRGRGQPSASAFRRGRADSRAGGSGWSTARLAHHSHGARIEEPLSAASGVPWRGPCRHSLARIAGLYGGLGSGNRLSQPASRTARLDRPRRHQAAQHSDRG
jgi:hypothetical protein